MTNRGLRKFIRTDRLQAFLRERSSLDAAYNWCHRHNMFFRRHAETDNRYFRWLYLLELTRGVEGDIVELGVGPGAFLIYCNTWLQSVGSTKRYWGYDSFAGFPSVHEFDRDGLAPERHARVQPGFYSGYSRTRMEKLLRRGDFQNVRLVEGDLAKTVSEHRPERISFLYFDCDLYEGYKAGLEALFDRVAPGGAVLFDEYEKVKEWPGARRAVDDFFLSRPEKPQRLVFSDSHFVLKRPRGEGRPA